VIASTPEEMTAHLNAEIKKWRAVFKEQGIKAQ
jgi:tripartite-type tricarboxylate transporter receptor subunit TctC